MKTFDKYGFILDLNDFLINEINNGNETDINTLIYEYIDNECIYYSDCWNICQALNANDFTAFDIECTTINQLAYCALWELVCNELNISEIETLHDEKFNQ
jgi:hypothetical protein